MTAPKLKHVLSILCDNLEKKQVPHAIIGAMALSFYGMPRFTADIDLLSDETHRKTILAIMSQLGYNCFQDAGSFAQFDSELGVYGRVDFMFVSTKEGRDILGRRVIVKNEVIGLAPVVQPTDYAVLKLMAMANNEDRNARDTADLQILFKSAAAGFLPASFQPINVEHLKRFADRFHLYNELESILPLIGSEKRLHMGKSDA